jgi:hypothetical protein
MRACQARGYGFESRPFRKGGIGAILHAEQKGHLTILVHGSTKTGIQHRQIEKHDSNET